MNAVEPKASNTIEPQASNIKVAPMKTPQDPPLFLTVFLTIAFGLILTAWALLPSHIETEGSEDRKPAGKVAKPLRPEEAIKKTEATLAQAEEILAKIEKAKATKKRPAKKSGAKSDT